jgi:protoporphyrinogen oxidase
VNNARKRIIFLVSSAFNADSMTKKKVAIIIGAGPAGLTAAYSLLKNAHDEIHPIVLEATNAIGGISKTVEYKGNRLDIGGHRFFSKSKEITDLWHEIMPLQGKPSEDDVLLNRFVPLAPGGPNPAVSDRVMLSRNRVSRILYLHKFFDYPIALKWRTIRNLGFGRTAIAGFGYMGSVIHKRKEQSLADFYINRFGKPLYKMFFEDYTEKVWGRNPRDISPEWGSQRVKGLSLWKALTSVFIKDPQRREISLIDRYEYPKRGPGALYEEMARQIIAMGGEIRLNSVVTSLKLGGENVTEIICSSSQGSTTLSSDYVISSMPLKDLYVALGKQNVPEDAYEIATHLIYRDFITVGLLVRKLLISNNTNIKTIQNRIPDTWIYVQEREVKLGRLQIFNNWSPYMVAAPNDSLWLGLEYFATEGDALWEMPQNEFIAMAISELVSIGLIAKTDVLDATEVKVKKAYPAYFGTYQNIEIVRRHINSLANLYCIGRNGQHRYNNMDHSMLTALDAVKSIMDPTAFKKKDIWNVNAEKDYAEAK